MTVHIIKLSVGSEGLADMHDYQRRHADALRKAGQPPVLAHRTRTMPKRRAEVLDGGSIYWVVKGVLLCRNPILDLEPAEDAEGRSCCLIRYGHELVQVAARPHRPFQGWRYLEAADAPPDLPGGTPEEGAMPPEMAAELRALGLL